MAIYLGGETVGEKKNLDDLSPRQIVAELDKYVVGQNAAKKAVAIALRNRIRRQKLPPEIAEDVLPKNILMIGSTGVGKTEIARRLARLANSPFIKIEASKFTEVGYVGRDVESMIRRASEIVSFLRTVFDGNMLPNMSRRFTPISSIPWPPMKSIVAFERSWVSTSTSRSSRSPRWS